MVAHVYADWCDGRAGIVTDQRTRDCRDESGKAKSKNLDRPRTPRRIVACIEKLARTTEMSVRQIHREIGEEVGRSVAGNIVKESRQTMI